MAEPEDLLAAGVTDAASFADAYRAQQWATARLLFGMATGAALFGGVLFGIAGPRRAAPNPRVAAAAA